MKFLRLLPAFAFLFNPLLQAADAPAKPAADLSKLKTADELWQHLRETQQEPATQPKSREEAMAMMSQWLESQRVAAETFTEKFPTDPRRWQARLVALRAASQWRQVTGQKILTPDDRKVIDEIIAAPDAPVPVKGEAAFFGVIFFTTAFDKTKPETFTAFYDAAAAYGEKYADHPLAQQMKSIQLQVLNEDPTPAGEAILKKLASGSDPRVAEPAKQILARRQKLADLKSKPLDLKFTAVDGREVDFTKLQGKVVLLDFWASWCGPCMAELPNVLATYQKLHSRGFEIVGVSLDQEKAAMDGVIEKNKLAWPQYFDGKGWETKISSEFGITAIPAAWLFDKKGILREVNLVGEELGAGVEKLLAE